mmetsp:Transcript_162852/g.522092  ORF Transcript_162852/g.522092 Transcript_162852/m.522092 type:complete len:210 (+) Transcript_162852:1253-1882(+)
MSARNGTLQGLQPCAKTFTPVIRWDSQHPCRDPCKPPSATPHRTESPREHARCVRAQHPDERPDAEVRVVQVLQKGGAQPVILSGQHGESDLHLADCGMHLSLDHGPDTALHPLLDHRSHLLHLCSQDRVDLLLHALLHDGVHARRLLLHAPVHLDLERPYLLLHVVSCVGHLCLHAAAQRVVREAAHGRLVDGLVGAASVDLSDALDP